MIFQGEKLAVNVHLYTIRNNKFEHLVGDVSGWPAAKNANFTMVPAPEGRSHFGYECSSEPGKVYNATVWFPNESTKRAIAILQLHETNEINQLKSRINIHERRYSLLQELAERRD